MSKILDMAKNFEQKSKEQASDTEKVLESAFKNHEKRINELLKQSEKAISSDIAAQNARIRPLLVKTWVYLSLALITLIIAFWSILAYQSYRIKTNWETISGQSVQIQNLKAQGGNIKMSHCTDEKNRSRLCVQINKEAGNFQNGYMIPMDY